MTLQGEITRIQYVTEKDNNAAFVYMNYLDAFKKSNWETLFSDSGDGEGKAKNRRIEIVEQ